MFMTCLALRTRQLSAQCLYSSSTWFICPMAPSQPMPSHPANAGHLRNDLSAVSHCQTQHPRSTSLLSNSTNCRLSIDNREVAGSPFRPSLLDCFLSDLIYPTLPRCLLDETRDYKTLFQGSLSWAAVCVPVCCLENWALEPWIVVIPCFPWCYSHLLNVEWSWKVAWWIPHRSSLVIMNT